MARIPSGYRPYIVTSPTNTYCRRNFAAQIRKEFARNGIHNVDIRSQIARTLSANRDNAMSLMKEVLSKRPLPDGVVETQDSFRVTDGALISVLMGQFYNPKELRETARLTLIRDLSELGYDMALMMPDPEEYEPVDEDFLPKADTAGIKEDRHIFVDTPIDLANTLFPRDHFTQIGKTLFLNPNYYGQDVLGLKNWAKGLTIKQTTLGHGGECVIGDAAAFLCPSYLPPDISNLSNKPQEVFDRMIEEDIEHKMLVLHLCGIRSFAVPHTWSSAFPPEMLDLVGAQKPILIPMDHADMSLLYLSRDKALFTLESYYREHKDLLDRIVEEVSPDIFDTLPDEDGLPANSLPLPDGGVFMDKAAGGSINKLRSLGIRVETTSRPFGEWAWGSGGGIHCATNEIWLPN
jgi:hypothetical protein